MNTKMGFMTDLPAAGIAPFFEV